MSEEQTGFKVTDRRLFNPDGTPRDSGRVEEERSEPTPAPAPPPVAAAEPRQPEAAPAVAAPAAVPQRQVATAELPAIEPEDDSDPEDPASFANFTMWVASNAASALGMMEHPATGERSVDLEIGKHWVDVLGMMQRKTRGNLNNEESQILESLLADLRMQYVSLTGGVQAASPRGYTASDILGG